MINPARTARIMRITTILFMIIDLRFQGVIKIMSQNRISKVQMRHSEGLIATMFLVTFFS